MKLPHLRRFYTYSLPALIVVLMLSRLQACSNSDPDTASVPDGRKVYMQQCTLCHGADGKLGLSGATDLSISQLTQAQVKEVVTNGRKTMQPFKGLLSEAHIDAVTTYILTLRENN